MIKYIFIFSILIITINLHAEVLKVGGTYKIKSINQHDKGYFIINFESIPRTGKFDQLQLKTYNVHFALKQSDIVKISCELEPKANKNNVFEIAQVVIFLNSSQGRTPIWLTSINKPIANFDEANYLEIHAPQSDYLIF